MTFQTSYKALAGNIAKLRDLDCMPIQIDFKPLDERDGLENTFVRCKKNTRAQKLLWSLQFYEVETGRKKTCAREQPVGGKYTRSAPPASLNNSGTCVFVESILHIITLFTMFEHLVRFGLGLVWLIPVSGSVRLYCRIKRFWRS